MNKLNIAFDGCHKLYICESARDANEARQLDYSVREMTASELFEEWRSSCALRFVNTWGLNTIVPQGSNQKEARRNINQFFSPSA